jgi:hypothetical protein
VAGTAFARVIRMAEEEMHAAPRAACTTGRDPAPVSVTLAARTACTTSF